VIHPLTLTLSRQRERGHVGRGSTRRAEVYRRVLDSYPLSRWRERARVRVDLVIYK